MSGGHVHSANDGGLGYDPLELIDNLEPYREALRGVVATFIADGFTDEQARVLVVHLFTWKQADSGDES